MPNGRTHRVVGGLAGAGYALHHAQDEGAGAALVETCGGIAGGIVGGSLPDILEPARNNPRHRGPGHSVTALLGVAYATLEDARQHCRARAESYRVMAARSGLSDARRLWYTLLEMFWRFLAGALSGLQAGYGSHLALDALTPAGLPLIV